VLKLTFPLNIRVAKSGQILTATEESDLKVNMQVNGEIRKILISGVLFVSRFECNLFSVRKLEMNGFTVTFENGKRIIRQIGLLHRSSYRQAVQVILWLWYNKSLRSGWKFFVVASSPGSFEQCRHEEIRENGRIKFKDFTGNFIEISPEP